MDTGRRSEEERLAAALRLALAHVDRRERTEAELRAHLERKGISERIREAVLQELVDTHLVDDERFAAMFVADKRMLEQWGSERIRRDLHRRGIDRELAERALAAGSGRDDAGPGGDDVVMSGELGRALDLLRRRFPEPPRDRRERDRALGVLLRKGYESELAVDALAAHARDG